MKGLFNTKDYRAIRKSNRSNDVHKTGDLIRIIGKESSVKVVSVKHDSIDVLAHTFDPWVYVRDKDGDYLIMNPLMVAIRTGIITHMICLSPSGKYHMNPLEVDCQNISLGQDLTLKIKVQE